MLEQAREFGQRLLTSRAEVKLSSAMNRVDIVPVKHIVVVILVDEFGPNVTLGGYQIEVNTVHVAASVGLEVDNLRESGPECLHDNKIEILTMPPYVLNS